MSEKKRFLLRLDGDLFAALEKWAADDLRSINAQIEYLLAESVRQAGRSRRSGSRDVPDKGLDKPRRHGDTEKGGSNL